MGRIVSIIWILATVVVNIFSLGALLEEFGIAKATWGEPVLGLAGTYGGLVGQAFGSLSSLVNNQLGISLPWWVGHVFIIYAASASAIAVSGIGVADRDSLIETAQSGGLSMIWPAAILAFVWKAIRLRIVSRFARDHALALAIYAFAVVGGYAGARYINAYYLLDSIPAESGATSAQTL